MLKVLFIGGTGVISTSVSEYISSIPDIELYLLNRGLTKKILPDNIHMIHGDYSDKSFLDLVVKNNVFDVIVNWIAFTPDQIRGDIKSFSGMIGQYIFISSAAAYKRPPDKYPITEDLKLENPHWQYAKNKIECEEVLADAYLRDAFPMTIVRPNYTYDKTSIPFIFTSRNHRYTLIDRMRRGRKIIIPGDGTSLFTITHSRDFAKGFSGLIGSMKSIGEAYHITGDEAKTWNEFAVSIGKAARSMPEILHVPSDLIAFYSAEHKDGLLGDKAHSMLFDNSKIKEMSPDFTAEISFDEGIRESVEWYDSNPILQRIDVEFNMLSDKIASQMRKAYDI